MIQTSVALRDYECSIPYISFKFACKTVIIPVSFVCLLISHLTAVDVNLD